MANSVDPDQTAPIGAVCSGYTLFASILNLSVMLGNYFHQTTSADDIFRCIFFLGALWVNASTKHLINDKTTQYYYYDYIYLKIVRSWKLDDHDGKAKEEN